MGEYQLGQILGRGAMGEVYAAKEVEGESIAAVKVLVKGVARDPTLLARFQREGSITADLDCPHLVKVLEAGIALDNTPFIAMEFFEGHDLAWHLRRKGTFSIADALMLCEHISIGLDAAHDGGVIHRDIKPRNLFLAIEEDGEKWKILDFGIAKLKTASGSLTRTALVGTPGYMAPEQAEGRAVDERADLFALGGVMYRVLTGRPPFSGEGPAQIIYEVVHRHPQRPSKFEPTLTPEIEYVLAIALAKDPRHRFATGKKFFDAMRAAASGELDERVHKRARRILDAQPWGSVVHTGGGDSALGLTFPTA